MMKQLFILIAMTPALFAQAQWWPDVRITSDPYNSYTRLRRIVDASNDTVHVVWYDESMEHTTVHYCRSRDAGLNWDTEAQLTTGEFYDEEPSVAASGNFVHVVWIKYESWSSLDNQICYIRSTDGGEDWESEIQFTNYSGLKWHPAVALSGNYVHVIWYDQCNQYEWEIYYLRSPDYGETWDDAVRLTFDPERSVFCTLAASGPVLHVVWHDWRHGDPEVYYMRSDDNGSTWGEETRMTNCDGESRFPEIAASGSFVQIVFQDNKDGNFEIYSFTSLDSGVTWGPETRLTYGGVSSEHPFIAINGSESHIVWQDLRSGTYQVYYKLGHDYGATWDEEENIVNTFYNAEFPSLSFSGEWLHTVWQDYRDGNYEIYCKNKYVESTIGIAEKSAVGESYYVYPVPAGSRLMVDSRQFSVRSSLSAAERSDVPIKSGSAVRLSIVDLYGREVKDIANVRSFPYQLDISNLPDGVYILKMTDEAGDSEAVKFVKAGG